VRRHTRIANARQHPRALGHGAATPIVDLPIWGWSGATAELRGRVPMVRLRYPGRRATEPQAVPSATVCHNRDRFTIVPWRGATGL
jgi:hypothetical protein